MTLKTNQFNRQIFALSGSTRLDGEIDVLPIILIQQDVQSSAKAESSVPVQMKHSIE